MFVLHSMCVLCTTSIQVYSEGSMLFLFYLFLIFVLCVYTDATNVIQGVTFGYDGLQQPLFRNVHLNVDQSSRIALVGPNGAGKVRLITTYYVADH
jgi:ABC-type transport system involved in cytochrome bd biosynthesis fused ATPase/permease subunit